MNDGGGAGLVVFVIAIVWLIFGSPMRDLRSWTGNATYEDQLAYLSDAVKKRKVGSSPDYWLTKRSFGVNDHVGMIFGYQSDLDGCFEIAQMLNERYPVANYTCTPAN